MTASSLAAVLSAPLVNGDPMKYAYMSIRAEGAFLSFNRRAALAGASEAYRVSYGYSKDVHHHWDVPTFRLVGERIK